MIKTIKLEDQTIHLIGTGHVLKKSVNLVKQSIPELSPGAVAVELDLIRFKNLNKKQPRVTLKKALQTKPLVHSLFQFLLYKFQQKAGKQTKIKPGKDMIQAIKQAKKLEIPVFLIDQDIRITTQRLFSKMTAKEKITFLKGLILGFAGIGAVKNLDSILDTKDELLKELKKELPSAYNVLVTERNKVMANNIKKIKISPLVVVVGAAHVNGIAKLLNTGIKGVKKGKLT